MPAERGTPCRSILIADNDRESAESLATALGNLGNDVEIASDVESALEVTRTFRPDVVMIDLRLPGLGAYTAARLIRAKAFPRKLVLVAVTSIGEEEDRRRSEEAGFKYHLTKPAHLTALQELLSEME